MSHFLICKMVCGSNIRSEELSVHLLAGNNVYSPFYKFLVLKVAEILQQISRDRCSGCVAGYILDQLHPCMGINLEKKIERFLLKAKTTAVTRIDRLFAMYTENASIDSYMASSFMDAGKYFIETLKPRDLMDRRYINEDSVVQHPYDPSWLEDSISLDRPDVDFPSLESTPLTVTAITELEPQPAIEENQQPYDPSWLEGALSLYRSDVVLHSQESTPLTTTAITELEPQPANEENKPNKSDKRKRAKRAKKDGQ